YQSDAPHHRGLRADIDRVAADMDVGIAYGLQQLRQAQSVRHQLVEIELQLIGLGLAAPARDVDDARHGTETALQGAILQRREVEHGVVGRAQQPVSVAAAGASE